MGHRWISFVVAANTGSWTLYNGWIYIYATPRDPGTKLFTSINVLCGLGLCVYCNIVMSPDYIKNWDFIAGTQLQTSAVACGLTTVICSLFEWYTSFI